MSLLAAVFAATLFSSNALAQTVLFESDSTDTCYRIPAIVNAKDGSVFAFSDYRPCRADVGGGVIDVVAKRSKDNGKTWSEEHTTDQIFKLMNGAVHKLFFTSGRICQSSKVKVGKYYRIYSALCTNVGNVVLYSDDFGRNWRQQPITLLPHASSRDGRLSA